MKHYLNVVRWLIKQNPKRVSMKHYKSDKCFFIKVKYPGKELSSKSIQVTEDNPEYLLDWLCELDVTGICDPERFKQKLTKTSVKASFDKYHAERDSETLVDRCINGPGFISFDKIKITGAEIEELVRRTAQLKSPEERVVMKTRDQLLREKNQERLETASANIIWSSGGWKVTLDEESWEPVCWTCNTKESKDGEWIKVTNKYKALRISILSAAVSNLYSKLLAVDNVFRGLPGCVNFEKDTSQFPSQKRA